MKTYATTKAFNFFFFLQHTAFHFKIVFIKSIFRIIKDFDEHAPIKMEGRYRSSSLSYYQNGARYPLLLQENRSVRSFLKKIILKIDANITMRDMVPVIIIICIVAV